MIGKILNPSSNGWRTSKQDFNFGFCDVYPPFGPTGIERSDPAVPDVAQFRDRVRNGMYHLGYTKSHSTYTTHRISGPTTSCRSCKEMSGTT